MTRQKIQNAPEDRAIEKEDGGDLQGHIASLEEALKVHTPRASPAHWSTVNPELVAYHKRRVLALHAAIGALKTLDGANPVLWNDDDPEYAIEDAADFMADSFVNDLAEPETVFVFRKGLELRARWYGALFVTEVDGDGAPVAGKWSLFATREIAEAVHRDSTAKAIAMMAEGGA